MPYHPLVAMEKGDVCEKIFHHSPITPKKTF